LPDLDEVFLGDDDLEPGDEDTETVAAVDALGLPGGFDRDDETVVSEPIGQQPPAPPSSTRLSSPPGAIITVRPRVSAPPMAVPQIRAPVSAPPPFLASGPGERESYELNSDVALAEPEADELDDDAVLDEPDEDEPDEPQFAQPVENPEASVPDSAEFAEADLYSAPAEDLRPAAQPAELLRASFSPREGAPADPALSALFSSQPRNRSVRPPAPSARPAVPGGAPRSMPAVGASAPPPKRAAANVPVLGSAPPPPVHAPVMNAAAPVDRNRSPKTLVSGPGVAPAPAEPWAPPPRRARRGRMVLGVLALLAAVGAGFWYLERSEPGSLMLAVSSVGPAPLSGLELYLDGDLACRASPCDIAQLSSGTHFVRAKADGYPTTADQAVIILARQQAHHDIILARPPANARINIVTHVPGFQVRVDGTERGFSPVELTDLTVGEHTLELSKEDFASVQQQFVVERDGDRTVGPVATELLVGTLEVTAAPGSEDAEVRLNGELVALPLERELDARQKHDLTADKPGSDGYKQAIAFDADNPTVRLRIDLGRGSTKPDAVPPHSSEVRDPSPNAPAAAGQARLNFNSIPSSTVVLDGRPLGQTPVMGVAVSAGAHNVVFVHPERGRKAVQVDVDAGAKRTVSVRF
jgi:serine/threonine-protein kinase